MADTGHRPLTGSAHIARDDSQVQRVGNALTSIAVPPARDLPTALGGVCNPFTKPGYVSHEPYPLWKPFDETCTSPRLFAHLLGAVPTASTGPVAAMRPRIVSQQDLNELERTVRGRTVLLVGDVSDRTLIQNLCTMLGRSSQSVTADHVFGGALKNVESSTPPGDTLLADYCYVDQFDTLFTSFYHYGIEMADVWNKQQTYYGPQKFESRMSELLSHYISALTASRTDATLPPRRNGVDLAVFASGLWDLATWSMEDSENSTPPSSDLSAQRLKQWRARTIDMIASLKDTVGAVRVAWRSLPFPAPEAHGSIRALLASTRAAFVPTDESNERPFVFANRVAQLNNARRATLYMQNGEAVRGTSGKLWKASSVSELQLRDIPFGEMSLGQDTQNPRSVFNMGINPNAFLFWDAVLAHLRP